MSEIVQRVVEKIEIVGDDKAAAALNRVGDSAGMTNKVFDDFIMTIAEMNDRLATASKELNKAGQKTDVVGEKIEQGGNKGSKGMKGLFGTMFKANIAAMAVEKTLGFVVGNLSSLATGGWHAAKAMDGATGRVQGLSLALFDFGKSNPMEKIQKSTQVSVAVVERLENAAYRAATPFEQLEGGFANAASQLAPMGVEMDRILALTEKSAGAAKVFGDDAEGAITAISAAVTSGGLAGKKGLPAALKNMVGDLSKLKPERRLEKIEKALLTLGGPLEAVTQGPAEGFERLGIIAHQYLGKLVAPLYDRIGMSAGRVAAWLKEGEHWMTELADDVQDATFSVFNFAEGVWSGVSGFVAIVDRVGGVSDKLSLVWDLAEGIFSYVEFIGLGWKAAGEAIQVLSDPKRGMGKLYTYSEAISLKWSEIIDKILRVAEKMAKIAVPEWIRKKVPGVGSLFDGFAALNERRSKEREAQGRRLAKMEEREGLDPLTNETRRLKREALRDAKSALAGFRGTKVKVEQNIGKIEIVQDFRNQDPDRVLVEFVKGLERLGENAIQSTVGGQATVYEGGM